MNESEIDLRTILQTLYRWWWVIILVGGLSAVAAFVISTHMTPTYESSTLLIVGGSIDSSTPTSGELQTSEKLATTYAELAETDSVLNAAMGELGLQEKPRVVCSVLSGTQLLQITVSDSDPVRAANIANALAEQLILQAPNGLSEESLAYQGFVKEQLANLEQEIGDLSEDIALADKDGDTDAVTLLENQLREYRNTYSSLLGYLADTSTNSLRIFESASAPDEPIKPDVKQNTILAALIGVMLAAGIIYLIDYFDDTIKTDQEIEQAFHVPALGHITEIKPVEGTSELVDCDNLLSRQAEEYRMLNMSLKYSLPADELTRSFLFTSTNASEGKSLTTANLGCVAALAGQRVIIVDADMRKPRQNSLFSISASLGLSSYLVGEAQTLSEVICHTPADKLDLLPCGTIPPNPAELLISARMTSLLEELKAAYDLVLIDTPPVLAAADVAAIANHVDGAILVVQAGKTQFGAFSQALEILKRAEGKLLGVVMNRLPVKHSRYAGYYYSEYKV